MVGGVTEPHNSVIGPLSSSKAGLRTVYMALMTRAAALTVNEAGAFRTGYTVEQ